MNKKIKRYFSLFFRDWHRRGFKLSWEEEFGTRSNCRNNRRVWFLCHWLEDNGSYDYKTTDFILLLQKVILHMGISFVTLLRINKLKHVISTV